MTYVLDYDRKRLDLIELATLDESMQYEVDITEIHYDPKTKEIVLITASGCSCWSGEYEEERFKSLLSLKRSLLKDDRQYTPSYKGAEQLLKTAKLNLSKIK